MPNLFDIEPLIIARIKAMIPGLRTVDSISLLASAGDVAQFLPAAFVQPMQGETKTYAASHVNERQQWLITVCVENYRDSSGTQTTASKAGEHAHAIIAALNGWAPHGAGKQIQYEGRAAPYYETGYGEFPLQFGYDVFIHGA